jgi:hypothetical protein
LWKNRSEQPVRAAIVERHHRLRTKAIDHCGDPSMDALDRLGPADARSDPPGPARATRAETAADPRHEQACNAVRNLSQTTPSV